MVTFTVVYVSVSYNLLVTARAKKKKKKDLDTGPVIWSCDSAFVAGVSPLTVYFLMHVI